MNEKWIPLLKEMMTIPRIANRVMELNLTNDEAFEALPIMLEMSEENEDTKSLYLTSFDRSESGAIKKITVLSKQGKKKQYLENVKTQFLYPIDFEEGKDYDKLEERKLLVNAFAQFLKEDESGIVSKGIYIHGSYGLGKTFTLKRFARILAERNRKVGFISVPTLISLFQTAFSKSSQEDMKQEIINTLKFVDYLFIDDIGAESISSWFRDDILFHILSDRSSNQKATFFTSNYSYEELVKIEAKTSKEKYLDTEKAIRLVARIKMQTVPIQLIGNSRI